MTADQIPSKLSSLHRGEEFLRTKAFEIIKKDRRYSVHLIIIERTMNLADLLRQFETADEDLKVIQVLGMRMFNAFAASFKLGLSGYVQNSALIMRDILETIFLLDLFQRERALIAEWRHADKKTLKEKFAPVKVRIALDEKDGTTSMKRAKTYEMFSELAGHPNMKSVWLMRPQKDGDAVVGPFMEETSLYAAVSEMGQLAIQVGEQLNLFFPAEWNDAMTTRIAFLRAKSVWLSHFYQKPK